jgi:hypothetical protein
MWFQGRELSSQQQEGQFKGRELSSRHQEGQFKGREGYLEGPG